MGLTKEYLRYVPAGSFNIIVSPSSNLTFVTLDGQEGRFVAVGACEHVIIWDLRLGEKAQVLPGDRSVVTALCASPNKCHLAVGYSDGNVQVYDLKTAEVVSIFSGHRSEVTTLCYDSFGHKLASGSKDADVIVWDTVAEVGMCRLSGHRGAISQVVFMSKYNFLMSGSKDTFVKFWDLNTHHCFKTLVGHRTEVWGLTLMKDDRYLVTGCGDGKLRVWQITERDDDKNPLERLSEMLELTTFGDAEDPNQPLQCDKLGSLLRTGKGRVVSMYSDNSRQVLGCHGTDAQIELFYFCSDEEAKLRLKKRIKKESKNASKEEINIDVEQKCTDNKQMSLKDEVKRLNAIKLKFKPKSFHLVLGNGGELRTVVSGTNNKLDLYTISTTVKGSEPVCLRSITNQGHQSDIRAVSFSSDNVAIVSGSAESIKLWNAPTQTCLRTIATGYVLSTIFVPGDRHILAGLKDGKLLIVDVASGDILEEIPAHTKEVWSLCLQTDFRGCVSGSGDNTVKFWQFEIVVDEKSERKAKVLSLLHTRTLRLDDSVLCVKLSPNGKFIAAALLDSTVKIFFTDTFKFYLSLYGHKLPVVCMDISSDSALIATGSADRNVKIWGLDFGDCHKSIFAHDDTVIALQFVPKTHYFFTCGKDGKVKEWDAGSFNKIITLQGHAGEAFALAVSPNGRYVVSAGSDRVLRLYERTDQPLVLQDEEEEERERLEELATGDMNTVPGQPGLNLPSKKTVGSEKAAESILECLQICEQYKQQLAEHAALQGASTQPVPLPPAPLLMQALNVGTPDDFFLETIKLIRASDLEEALLLLPFTSVCEVLTMLPSLVASRNDCVELLCKVFMFLLKIHHAPIVANNTLLPTLIQLQRLFYGKATELRDLVGYNYYGMQYIQKQIEEAGAVQMFRDATLERKKGEKKRKQQERLKRSIMVLSG